MTSRDWSTLNLQPLYPPTQTSSRVTLFVKVVATPIDLLIIVTGMLCLPITSSKDTLLILHLSDIHEEMFKDTVRKEFHCHTGIMQQNPGFSRERLSSKLSQCARTYLTYIPLGVVDYGTCTVYHMGR